MTEAESMGSVGIELQVASGITLQAVTYTVVGPNSYSKTGSFDLSQSPKIAAILSAIPAGQGYSITLIANSVEGTASCSGSASFVVTPRQTTPVAVTLLCHEVPRSGSVLVNGSLNVCPSIDSLAANPAEVLVGSAIAVSASAHDADAAPAALSYHWSADSGAFRDASAPSTTFTCLAPGPTTLTVSVSDGDSVASCADIATIIVACTANVGESGGSGGSAGVGGNIGNSGAGNSGAAAAGAGGSAAGAGGSAAGAGGSAAGAGGSAAGAGGSAAGAGGSAAGAGGSAAGAGGSAAGSSGAANGGGSAEGGAAHLDVYRVGDGSGPLVNTGNPVFIDEYATDGSLVRSISMPLTVSGNNHRLVSSGTATSEGLLTRSVDGHFVLLTGYDAALPTVGLAGTTGTAVPRIVGRLAADGSVDTSTQVIDGASGNNPRSAVSTNGSQIWFAGAAGGVRFLALGNTSATTLQLSTTVTNLRQLNIFGSQLFVSDSSGPAVRLGAVGVGLPTTAGQTITNLPGFPLTGSPYGFYFADLDATVPGFDVVYVADDGLGLTKYALVAGAWLAKGTIGTAADAYRGLTAIVDAGTVTLYATRKGGSTALGGGELVSLVDAGGYNGVFNGTPTLLASAAANTAFRGVSWAPAR